ncbi:MAG: ImmA/IrrE family metallo-endopeptidase [Candidatus Limivicinus sp.]
MREDKIQFINDAVLGIYSLGLTPYAFPVDLQTLIKNLYACEYRSYQALAKLCGIRVCDVIRSFRSADGCTHRGRQTGQFLISVNEEGRSPGRIRWTTAHEIGHVVIGHFDEIEEEYLPENQRMEAEADYFAANLLAPFSAIEQFHICSAAKIRDFFGLSYAAAEQRWREYRAYQRALYGWNTNPPTKLKTRKPPDIWPDDDDPWYT